MKAVYCAYNHQQFSMTILMVAILRMNLVQVNKMFNI